MELSNGSSTSAATSATTTTTARATTAEEYAHAFWNQLSSAARLDGRSLDPVWENGGTANSKTASATSATTTNVILTETAGSDLELYQRFRNCFPSLLVQKLTNADLSGELWQSLLMDDNNDDDDNTVTLLRLDAHDMFWMDGSQVVSEGVTVVPRTQFLCIEIARLHEGIYATTAFRQRLCKWNVDCQTAALVTALQNNDNDNNAALLAIRQLGSQWPYPRQTVLKESGALQAVQLGWKTGSTEAVRRDCQELLQYWKDVIDLGKMASMTNGSGANAKQFDALERAGRALAEQRCVVEEEDSSEPIFPMAVSDLVASSRKAACDIFRKYGMLVITDFVETSEVVDCKLSASECLEDLIEEQLTPRGLKLMDNVIDFDLVSSDGYRVNNQYKVMDSNVVQSLGERLLEKLPSLLSDTNKSKMAYKLVRGGVIHSFPRKVQSQAVPDAQPWHRDGSSLYDGSPHETHCFNVFIPLADVSAERGTREFIPGSHNDHVYNERAVQELRDDPDGNSPAIPAELNAGSIIVADVRVLYRELPNSSSTSCPMLYFTIAKSWFQPESEKKETLVERKELEVHVNGSANPAPDAVSFRFSRLYELVSGFEAPKEETTYGHPHYTTRFDLMLANMKSESNRAANMDAILNFCTSGQQDNMANAFIDILRSPHSRALKQEALKEARQKRKEMRNTDGSDDWAEDDSFASFAADRSDVATLYKLTAKLALKDSWCLYKLGFTNDQDGVVTLLATLKAYSLRDTAKVKTARLEEAFTSWWHAGVDRFHLSKVARKPAPRVVVVFSSLGSGIARPEWGGSLTDLAPCEYMDVLHVLDPAFSWYCQDPTCEWKGGEYYFKELKKRLKKYKAVLFLGEAMGAAGALRFSSLANAVLCFSPHTNIAYNDTITRTDFATQVRQQFEIDVLHTCRETSARILVHYAERYKEDANTIMLLPSRRNIKLVAHDFDEPMLALHLREQGKLQSIIDDAFEAFMTAKFDNQPPRELTPSDALVSTSRASKWLPNGQMLGFGGMNQNTVPYEHNMDDVIPVFEAQLDVLMLEDGSLMFIHNGEEEVDFTYV